MFVCLSVRQSVCLSVHRAVITELCRRRWQLAEFSAVFSVRTPEIEYGGLNNLLSFALGTTLILLGEILGCSGRHIRSPGPLGLIPAALGISQSRKTRWVTQALTRAPVFTRRFEIFTEQPRREFAG